jgi:hypothetical protein
MMAFNPVQQEVRTDVLDKQFSGKEVFVPGIDPLVVDPSLEETIQRTQKFRAADFIRKILSVFN